MQAYWVSYLSDHPENASARPEPSGLYLHRILMRAAQPRDITRELRQRGATTVEIKPAKRSLISFWRNRVTPEMQHDFLLQLSFLVEKMSPERAFEAVAQAAEGSYRVRLEAGRQVFMQGGSFTEAVKAIEMFDDTTIASFEAAEPLGELPQTIVAALELNKAQQHNNLATKALMLFLGWQFINIYAQAIPLRFGFIPSIERAGVPQGTPEQLAEFHRSIFWAYVGADIALVVGGVIAAAAIVAFGCMVEKEGREFLRRLASRIPMVSKVFFDQHLASATAVMATLLPRMHFEQALRLVTNSSSNPTLTEYLKTVEKRVVDGEPSYRAMVHPPLQTQEMTLLSIELDDKVQLPSVLKVISERRLQSYKDGFARVRKYGQGFIVGYLLYVVAVAVYLLYTQGQAVTAALK